MRPAFYIPPINNDCKNLAAEAERQGFDVLRYEEEFCVVPHPLFFYGSLEGMKDIQSASYAEEIIDWCHWGKLACTSYYAKWGELMLTRHYGFYPLAELRRRKNALWATYWDSDGYCYVRPNSNDKVFGGGLFRIGYFESWLLQTEKEKLTDDLLCLVGTPTKLAEEYRLVVADGKVVTASMYMKNDKLHYERGCPPGARHVAEQAAAIWSPHPVFVLDVALTRDAQFRIIECGSIHTAGLYECDLAEVVQAIVSNSER